MSATNASKSQAKPFIIHVPQSVLDDLQDRLKRTRWPDEAPNSGWLMGTSLGYMKELADYWLRKYNWRKHETGLNVFNHFKADVDGVEVHFIHERGQGPNPIPIPSFMVGLTRSIATTTDPNAYKPGQIRRRPKTFV